MKTVRRILAVLLLVVVVLAVGYLCYTGSRLTATQEESCLQDACGNQTVFLVNGDDVCTHTDNAAVAAGDGIVV